MLLNGSEILIQCLLEQGVDTIFGYPGGSVLNIYDALYKYKDKINHILTCHEQGAAHAADGYARSTGKVGVCLATSGPGATNLVTGIATAYMDSIPMVAITGNVPKNLLGKDSFQEVDITGITMPITKHNYIVKDINKLADIVREAFIIAKSGRPGPVLIDIPKDITAQRTIYEYKSPKAVKRSTEHISDKSLSEAAKLINQSVRPFIYAGGGVILSEASKELSKFAKKINAPVSSSLMGLGAFDESDELFTGMVGMHGTKASNLMITKSDLIICIGARFSDRVVGQKKHIKNAEIIHIDVDPAEINKNIKSEKYVVGDIKEVLNRLTPLIDDKKEEQWLELLEMFKKNHGKKYYDAENSPEKLFESLNNALTAESFVVTDVGQHQMWTALNYKFSKPRKFITSGGLGTMGFGLGAAIGTKVANPTEKVVLITGDGSFAMNCNELPTLVKNNLSIVIVLINNNALGMVRQWQSLFYEGRYSETTLNRKTDFVKLAESFGAKGYRVLEDENFDDVLNEALSNKGPVLIDYVINSDKKVFPMVAPGEPIANIILEEDLN
ncbi:MAG: biosynthetic-type acetolactate synthase large subunit [Sarcina sp.]